MQIIKFTILKNCDYAWDEPRRFEYLKPKKIYCAQHCWFSFDKENHKKLALEHSPPRPLIMKVRMTNPIASHNPIDAFQIEIRDVFEQLSHTRYTWGSIGKIVESTHLYLNELAHQRAFIDCKEVMLAWVCS